MEAKRRSRLLKSLEIEAWVPRGHASGEAAVAEAPAAPSAESRAELRAETPPVAPTIRERAVAPLRTAAPAPVQPALLGETAPPPYVAPADWDGLAGAVAGCQRCKLCRTRTRTVFGVGPRTAPLMIVGEGPGADEDQQGEPFVGRAGKLLDEMLRSIGRSRADNTYIANVVKCRPPGNRDPEADEVAACRPYLDRQIELIRPKLIVALGRIAAQRLLSSELPLSKLRGPVHRYGLTQTPVIITYHPAYLLRSPGEKAKSWSDLKQVHRFLAAEA